MEEIKQIILNLIRLLCLALILTSCAPNIQGDTSTDTPSNLLKKSSAISTKDSLDKDLVSPTLGYEISSTPSATTHPNGFEPISNYDGYLLVVQVNDILNFYSLDSDELLTTINLPLTEYLPRGQVFFSPNGDYLAYEGQQDHQTVVYLYNLQTSKTITVFSYPTLNGDSILNSWGNWITWAPDGTKLAFTGFVDPHDDEIFIYDISVETVTNITNSPGFDYAPDWSPDGETILFLSTRDETYPQIFKMRPDGSKVQQLTTLSNSNIINPTWSPNGKKIAFRNSLDPSESVNDQTPGSSSIFSMDPDGKNITQLVNEFDYICPLCDTIVWSPDSQKIAFPATTVENSGIFSVDIDDKEIDQVNELTGPFLWSPVEDTLAAAYPIPWNSNSLCLFSIEEKNNCKLLITVEGKSKFILSVNIINFHSNE